AGPADEHTLETLMERIFETPEPIELYVELGKGSLQVTAGEVTSTTVSVTGRHADDVEIVHEGRKVAVLAPRSRGLFGEDSRLDVTVWLPTGSDLVTKTGSANQTTRGTLGRARVKTGSGDLRFDTFTGEATLESGSGDISIEVVAELRIKSGSGDVGIDRAEGECGVSTGSGDISIGIAQATVLAKTGSGDLRIRVAHADINFNGASGHLIIGEFHRGGLTAKNASGDIRIGVPGGIPIWTDLTTVTGRLTSNIEGAGEPTSGQDYIELRAKTASGDINLEQL
ncbi:MAG: DUF4097 domain-containing protein, partial [Nocardioides sp.]|nr:DUF4097 domain-containing protein [Nocardioides sp.]